MKKRKQYTAAFKARVALEAVQGEQTITELSNQFDVHPSMIYQWKKSLMDNASDIFQRRRAVREVGATQKRNFHAKIGGPTKDPCNVELGLLADNLGFHIRIASIALERPLKRLAGEDIRMGYFPVFLIIKLNPEATQSTIAEAVGLHRSSLVPILKKLEQLGWIERTGHEEDKRANRIRVTHKGEQACAEIANYVESIEESARVAMGNRQYTRLVNLLKEVEVIFMEPK